MAVLKILLQNKGKIKSRVPPLCKYTSRILVQLQVFSCWCKFLQPVNLQLTLRSRLNMCLNASMIVVNICIIVQ